MKVLKVGIDLKNWTNEVTCLSCKSELEIMASDIKYSLIRSFGFDPSDYPEFSVNCPLCDSKVILDQAKIPQVILTSARTKNKKW